jgi:hypothetical protein
MTLVDSNAKTLSKVILVSWSNSMMMAAMPSHVISRGELTFRLLSPLFFLPIIIPKK